MRSTIHLRMLISYITHYSVNPPDPKRRYRLILMLEIILVTIIAAAVALIIIL